MNRVDRISWADCADWSERSGRIRHRSGRFFDLVGVRSSTGDAVMIDQPEVGVLAFLIDRTTVGGGRILVNHKAEPGNVGLVQMAPTVQVTRSNIDRAHGGSATLLLDEVLRRDGRIGDALGSEQGDRFYAKVNRNLMRVVTGHLEPPAEHLEWMEMKDFRSALL